MNWFGRWVSETDYRFQADKANRHWNRFRIECLNLRNAAIRMPPEICFSSVLKTLHLQLMKRALRECQAIANTGILSILRQIWNLIPKSLTPFHSFFDFSHRQVATLWSRCSVRFACEVRLWGPKTVKSVWWGSHCNVRLWGFKQAILFAMQNRTTCRLLAVCTSKAPDSLQQLETY